VPGAKPHPLCVSFTRQQTTNKKMGLDICHVMPSEKTNTTLDFLTIDDFASAPDYLNRHRHLVTEIKYDDGTKISVIYYLDKGYQRKRMNKDFIKNFQNDKLYFDLATVRFASTFLEANEGESQSELEESFKKNFIDNFVESESIFFISW
jgi:hypothetical protein